MSSHNKGHRNHSISFLSREPITGWILYATRNQPTQVLVYGTTTTWKNVETLSRKSNLSCFKRCKIVSGPWDIILTSLLPPIQSCSSKFRAWSCIASNFDEGWRGDHKHKIMDRPFKPKYGTVSQVLLQLVVSFKFYFKKWFPRLSFPKRRLQRDK